MLVWLTAETALAASVEDGQALFQAQCGACHTIGGGDLGGPDLEGVVAERGREWVLRFVLDPQQVVDSGDPVANALVEQFGMVMPGLGLSEDQVASLVAFLEAEGGAAPAESAAPETQAAETQPTETAAGEPATTEAGTESAMEPPGTVAAGPGDPDVGKGLFTGNEDLANGGPSCMSCHTIAGIGSLGGGAVGPDLTGAAERYGTELPAVIESAAFPTMQPLFAGNEITPQEAADLAAFVAEAPQADRPGGAVGKLLLLGFGGAAFLAAVGLVAWRKRLNGVRRPLVDGSRSGRK
jgi:mono/diheme cytochrome c family protein